MKTRSLSPFWVLVIVLSFIPSVLAQDDLCPVVVRNALSMVSSACSATERNQVCYGNIFLEAEPQSGVTNLAFEKLGDIADIAQLASLRLSTMNVETLEWGVALMRVQANLPATVPGQNVLFLLFGDVKVENSGVEQTPTLTVTATGNLNVRGGPSTNHSVIGQLTAGQTVNAIARNQASDWLHVELSEDRFGWVYAPLVTADGDIRNLDLLEGVENSVDSTEFGPMQAFYFQSGIGDAPCAEAPDSGILIQTPEGAGQIELWVNEVNIRLGSTVFLQAVPGAEMFVNVLEGWALVEAFDAVVGIPAGMRARIPLDTNSAASGPPIGPEPLDALGFLPLENLDTPVTVAEPPDESEIAIWSGGNAPQSGIWQWTWDYLEVEGIPCACGIAPPQSLRIEIAVGDDGSTWIYRFVDFEDAPESTVVALAPGVYQASGNFFTIIDVLSSEVMRGESREYCVYERTSQGIMSGCTSTRGRALEVSRGSGDVYDLVYPFTIEYVSDGG